MNFEGDGQFKNGTKSRFSFKAGKQLGQGGFGKCYEATPYIKMDSLTQQTYALKVMPKKSKKKVEQMLRECKIHSSLKHKNIVDFVAYFDSQKYLCIVMQICKGDSLNNLIKKRKGLKQPFSDQNICQYTKKIVEGVKYLHQHQIIHRDIKPANIFLTENNKVKIGDFGLAFKVTPQNQNKKSFVGTPNFIAPEILFRQNYSYPVDVWSIGVTIYILKFFTPPFEVKNDSQLTFQKIKSIAVNYHQNQNPNSNLIDLLKKIFVKDPKQRINLQDMLKHPFLKTAKSQVKNQPSNKEDQNKSQTPNGQNASSQQKSATQSTKNQTGLTIKRHLIDSCILVQQYLDDPNYGVQFRLSNGIVGIYFNDCTQMLTFDLPKSSEKYNLYWALTLQAQKWNFGQEKQYKVSEKDEKQMTLEEKKVLALFSYKQYLKHDSKQIKASDIKSLIHINNFLRTKCALIFRLTSEDVQCIFTKDQSEIIIQNDQQISICESNQVTRYSSKNKGPFEKLTTETKEKLNFLRDICHSFLFSNSKPQNQISVNANKSI